MSDLIERFRKLQADAGIPHLPTELTYECRMAVSGEGPRAFDWSDKPHRLVYDLSREVERLTAERDAALAMLARYEQALGTLHGDSLDAIMEVIGEGEKFVGYNLGKSKMRDWFLRRISRLIARPEVTK